MNITAGESVTVKNLIETLRHNFSTYNYMGMANIRICPEIAGHERTGRDTLVIELIENDKCETICLNKLGEKVVTTTTIIKPSWFKRIFGGKKWNV